MKADAVASVIEMYVSLEEADGGKNLMRSFAVAAVKAHDRLQYSFS